MKKRYKFMTSTSSVRVKMDDVEAVADALHALGNIIDIAARNDAMESGEVTDEGLQSMMSTDEDAKEFSATDSEMPKEAYMYGMMVPFNVENYGGHIMQKGCFDKFLGTYSSSTPIPIRSEHQNGIGNIIGYWERFEVKEDGLYGLGYFYDTQMARDCRTVMMSPKSCLQSFSVGIEVDEYVIRQENDMYAGITIQEASIFEVSVVAEPAFKEAKLVEVMNAPMERTIEHILRDVGMSIKNSKKNVSSVMEFINNLQISQQSTQE